MNKENWNQLSISECADVIGGGTPSTKNPDYWDGNIPWIAPKDLSNNKDKYISNGKRFITQLGLEKSSAKLLPENSLLFSSRAPIGYLAINTKPVATNQGFKSLIFKDGFDVEFFYYLFKNKTEYIKNFASGSTFQEVSGSVVKNLSFLIPPKQEQKRISNILSKLDKKIELNQKMNENLEEIAKTLFKSWFIDFDPVRAKAEGRPTGLSKEISDLFPDSFEDSELGEIPTGWKVSKLESIFDVLGGHAFKSKDYVDNGVFVLRTKNFNKGIAEPLHDDVFLPKSFLDSHQDFICEEYDYHLVMVGASLGKTGMIFASMMPALRNQNMWCFRPREAKFSKLFTKFVVDTVTKKLLGFASGSARDFFKKGDFRSHKLVIPPETILESFRSITDPLLTKKSKNIEETKLITNLRDILLPKLISGELQIPDAENLIEEAGV